MLPHGLKDLVECVRHGRLEVAGVDLTRQVVGLELLVSGVLDGLLNSAKMKDEGKDTNQPMRHDNNDKRTPLILTVMWP